MHMLWMVILGDEGKSTKMKKKQSKCDCFQSIRTGTFFHQSHLSLYQIVTFSYLWLENVSLLFLLKQVKIAKHTAAYWASFHREVVFDAMILQHKKIGKFLRYFSTFTQKN